MLKIYRIGDQKPIEIADTVRASRGIVLLRSPTEREPLVGTAPSLQALLMVLWELVHYLLEVRVQDE